mgnify:CR=1 FL=1
MTKKRTPCNSAEVERIARLIHAAWLSSRHAKRRKTTTTWDQIGTYQVGYRHVAKAMFRDREVQTH